MNKLLLAFCPSLFITPYIFPFSIQEADKDGFINVYFVKIGWFWTTLVSLLCIIRYSDVLHHWKRYVLISLWWVMFTQEFFGLTPLMDLIFLYSGGACSFDIFEVSDNEAILNGNFHETTFRRSRGLKRLLKWLHNGNGSDNLKDAITSLIYSNSTKFDVALNEEIIELSKAIRSSSSCAKVGGHWVGGHDPSGHIFLITLMLMMMAGELSYYKNHAFHRLRRTTPRFLRKILSLVIQLFDNSGIANLWLMQDSGHGTFYLLFLKPPLSCFNTLTSIIFWFLRFLIWENPLILLVSLMSVWAWSFIVTMLLFHTLAEKVSGFLSAYIVSLIIYSTL